MKTVFSYLKAQNQPNPEPKGGNSAVGLKFGHPGVNPLRQQAVMGLSMTGSMRQVIPFLTLFKLAFANFRTNDPVRMAGATAFFAFFGLPPIIIILSQVYGALLQKREQAVSIRLFDQLAETLGPQSARQLEDISQHLQQDRTDPLLTAATIALLLLGATTLFAVMKRSLNQLWNVKPKEGGPPLNFLKDRVVALAIILFTGFLFMVSMVMNQTLDLLSFSSSDSGILLLDLSHFLTSVVALTIWFALLFTYLPDIRVPWRAVWMGALVTGLLFTLGELVLSHLLTYAQIRSLHGPAGRITLVLLFVYYCSLIFYFGAAFTRQYADWTKAETKPSATAIGYTITESDNPDRN